MKHVQIPEVVEWCMDVPNCSTFRVNTSMHNTEDIVSYLEKHLAKVQKGEL